MGNNSGSVIYRSQDRPTEYVEHSDGHVTISIPIQLKRRSGRSLVGLSDGSSQGSRPWDEALTPLQQALAKAHMWQGMIESGEFESIKALAERVGIDPSYASRTINLTYLAPDIIQAILDDQLPAGISLASLSVDTPKLWGEQRIKFN